MRRLSWVWLGGLVLLAALVLVGAVVPAPVVAVGRGPTFDTLGDVEGSPVVAIDEELRTYPTSGRLNMTTVGVTDGLTLLRSIGLWASDEHRVVPRNAVFPPELTGAEVTERNRQQFVGSQTSAEAAALSHLGMPVDVVVEQLTADSPAAGVLEPGDVLTAVDGEPLSTYRDLTAALADTEPGDRIAVAFRRGATAQDGFVALAPRPDGPQGALGVIPGARPVDEDAIVFSLADIGGPSAGLMFALAVVDKLTPGALTGDRFVAGTGTIASIGPVGPIDGIPFKMRAAKDAGATVFLVPAANCAEALATAPDDLRLIRVDDLAGAVTSLDELAADGSPASC